MTTQPKLEAIAAEVLASLSSGTQIAPFSSRPGGLTLTQAYSVTPLLRAAFEARGEIITGRKIGFTNRQMWTAFGVSAPIWGYTTSRTTHDLADLKSVSLNDFVDPRIEPEIMFGLGTAPSPTMSDDELMDCVAWIALGYEIVQSIFPHWKFQGADTVAANGVHGMLLIGSRHPMTPRKKEWLNELSTFEVELCCDGKEIARGGGALVLGSPLKALRHLVELLANDRLNPPPGAGEVISTGTLTLAPPIKPGERWTTRVSGIPLGEITVQFG
jgi:2-oxo-3-hexenedioate decarboxylase